MDRWLNEIELKGDLVSLVPLRKEHADALVEASNDGKLWEIWYTGVPSKDSVDGFIDKALADQALDKSLPFLIIENETQRVLGSSRYLNAEKVHRRLEIGHTWYRKSAQRSGVNTECKLLLLSHAFEELGALCVQFRTHWHNHASRNAIERLGAKQDGVLRNHLIDAAGASRDTVVFSILENEWSTVKQSLIFRKHRGAS